jgi:hypothetical protein
MKKTNNLFDILKNKQAILMDVFLTFFTESNIKLSNEQRLMSDRLTENLRNAVKVNTNQNDELIMLSKEYEELTRFVSHLFLTNKKVMSPFVWKTVVGGIIGGARSSRDY